ncbi:hypothetical protein B6D60_03370 [candidate division KSB1 bacterium 4484_87]|nr:MAG: hypothetical protein B6D60_03370 [candidate division KSB1 bacterium 4484_87]
MKKIFTLIFWLTLITTFLHADEKKVLIDSVSVKEGNIVVSFHAQGIFDEKVIQGLRRGLTSTFQYEVQLWERKSRWVNSLIISQSRRIKVYFDNWEKKYLVLSPEERRLTASLEKVQKHCTRLENVALIPLTKISPKKKYFVSVKAVLRPLSMENYQEIKNWLSGSAKNLDVKNLDDSEEQERRIKGGFLKLLLSLTGFGDKVISGKSNDFNVQAGKVVFVK